MKRAPAVRLGVLFLLLAAAARAQDRLASELLAERNWKAAAREFLRALEQDRADENLRLGRAIASVRAGRADESIRADLRALASSSDVRVRSLAALECGRTAWSSGRAAAAFASLRQAFLDAPDLDPSLLAGCALAEFIRSHPGSAAGDPALLQQLETCRPLWTPEIRARVSVAADPGSPDASGGGLGAAVVAFYRAQIRPAIGARCSLDPNCSEYLLQASRKHRWAGLPMMADRLVREPSVVAAAEHPLRLHGKTVYADPLEDHDGWMKGSAECRAPDVE